MSTYVTDNHTLYIKFEYASAGQIRQAVNEALTNYQKATKSEIECNFRVNRVENRDGEPQGFAFVFLTNPAVYYMLLGRNPDGSDRIEYVDDPTWNPPTTGDVNDSGWSRIAPPVYVKGKSWADETEEEEQYWNKIEAEKQKHVRPKIAMPLEPLMVLPPYELTDHQVENKRVRLILENEDKPDFDPNKLEVSKIAHFIVSSGLAAREIEANKMPNILKARNVPDWVTKEDLKVQFSPYAEDSTTLHRRSIKGRSVDEAYPFVNINDDRIAFIIYDPSTYNAFFALHMMKKTVITKKTSSGVINSVTLMFNHSFRTDRDLMADISQRSRPIQKREQSSSVDEQGFRQQANTYHHPHSSESGDTGGTGERSLSTNNDSTRPSQGNNGGDRFPQNNYRPTSSRNDGEDYRSTSSRGNRYDNPRPQGGYRNNGPPQGNYHNNGPARGNYRNGQRDERRNEGPRAIHRPPPTASRGTSSLSQGEVRNNFALLNQLNESNSDDE